MKEKLLNVMLLGVFAAMMVGGLGIIGAATPWQSSGNSMWFDSESITDADSAFNTAPVHLGSSEVGCVSLNVTALAGASKKVDCTLYSGVSATVANGTSTGVSYTQITGVTKEMKCVEGKKFHPYMWALCADSGTTSTITVGAYTSGKQ